VRGRIEPLRWLYSVLAPLTRSTLRAGNSATILHLTRQMANLTAVCEDCGTTFTASRFIKVSGTARIHMSGNRYGPCPRCGGMGRIPDGTYDIVGDVVTFLASPQRSHVELQLLADILQEAQRTNASLAEISASINKQAPGLAKVAEVLSNAPGPLMGYIAIIIAALTFLLQLATEHRERTSGLSPSDIGELIDRAVRQAVPQPPPTAAQKPTARSATPTKKVRATPRPNEPCLCGSGRPYKKCHGKPRKGRR
jgi:SEC-C motif-containing protein